MKSFFNAIWILFHPAYWIMNYPYSKLWDMKLRKLMEDHRFTEIDDYSANLGDTKIWIANHPYASFVPYATIFDPPITVRPSKATIRMAKKKLNKDILRRLTQN